MLAGLEGRIAAVIDSGSCRVGLESTVIDLSGPVPVLLRPGGVNLESLEASIGPVQRGMPIEQARAARIYVRPECCARITPLLCPLRVNAAAVDAG